MTIERRDLHPTGWLSADRSSPSLADDLFDVTTRVPGVEGLAMLDRVRDLVDCAPDLRTAWTDAFDLLAAAAGFARWLRWVPAGDPDGSPTWRREPHDHHDEHRLTAVELAVASLHWGWAHDLLGTADLGSSTALLAPIVADGQAIAVIEFCDQERLVPDTTTALVAEVAGRLGDTIERRRLHEASEFTEAMLFAAFDDASTGMALVVFDDAGRSSVIAANTTFGELCSALGHTEPVERFDQFSPAADVWLRRTREHGHHHGTVCEQSVDGPADQRWVRLSAAPVRLDDAAPDDSLSDPILVHVEDITIRRRALADLAHHALHDELTGLPNRALVGDRIRHAQDRSHRVGGHLGVLFVDLDHFKDVNDSLGHHAGDELLQQVAHRFAAHLRPNDTAARVGGDEFVILCEDLADDPTDAVVELSEVAHRLHRSLADPFELPGSEGWITSSIGLHLVHGSAEPVATVLGDAEVAMYRAKANGRARTEVFDETMRQAATERMHIAGQLRRAIDRRQMWCEYQPIVRLADGELLGAEALLRWHHPDLGQVAPSRFIDIAEESDLILELGEFVAHSVCHTAAARPQLGYVAMNVSARQLARSDFSTMLLETIDQAGVDRRRIAVELTENVLMDVEGSALGHLEVLRAAGLPIGVDDFGTGFASLTYLRRLPVTFVKIDKSFVDGILDNADDHTIVDGTIGLAHALGLALVAEGVEQPDQALLLAALGCESGQGYLFSRPTIALDSLADAGAVIREGRLGDGRLGDTALARRHPSRSRRRR